VMMMGTAKEVEVSGSVQVYWRGMKRSVRASRIRVRGHSWRAVVETKLFGFGRVRPISS